MVSEWSLSSPFICRDDAFQYDLSICGNHYVDARCSNQGNTCAAKQSGESNFIDVFRKRQNSRNHKNGIGASDERNFKIFALLFGLPIMPAPPFHALPMHSCHIVPKHLKPVEPYI